LKGAVIHRFCERYTSDQNAEECLRRTFDEVARFRQAELADRLVEIDTEAAVKDLLPLALNYLASDVYSRVEQARDVIFEPGSKPSGEAGLWSELAFRLRRPLGVVSGAIDKLLIRQTSDGSFEVEIIDFKTNRIAKRKSTGSAAEMECSHSTRQQARTTAKPGQSQFSFDFDAQATVPPTPEDGTIDNVVRSVAEDYQLQMQVYALAVRELIPSLSDAKIRVTLHFLEPNLEYHLDDNLLDTSACEAAIDAAILDIVSATEPAEFPVKPAAHCRMCNFLRVCAAGREELQG